MSTFTESGFRGFLSEYGIGTGIGKIWYRKKVSEPVSVKFGIGEKSRDRYCKNLVPGKSNGTGIGKIWYRQKVSELVSEKFWYREKVLELVSVKFGIG